MYSCFLSQETDTGENCLNLQGNVMLVTLLELKGLQSMESL